MLNKYTFAKFWRCALQVNPYNYRETYRGISHGLSEEEYNQKLLQICLEHEIKVVGLADHGSVSSIDAIRKVLNPKGIVVFPGFEIASNDKTHYVCLFSETTTEQQLERYLGNLKILDPKDGVHPSTLSSQELIDVVDQLGGFIYAAHCTQENGLLKNRLKHVWKHSKLRAAQIPGSIDNLKNAEQGFYRTVLQNKNPDYMRDRPVAAINAKDIANPEDLALDGATCLIKMTRPTFEAFKVAFLDPESRIRLNSQQSHQPIGKVRQMSISGGYLDGVLVSFSDHLNTVIGGRGTGKSTLLECLRYTLDLPPKGNQAKKIHKEIIEENLGKQAGRVQLQIVSSSQNGKKYTVSRCYGEPPIVRDESGEVSTLLPKDLLPNIEIYGQNEIYELAQNKKNRLLLLDRFIPKETPNELEHSQVRLGLNDNQQSLVQALISLDELKEQVGRLPKLEEQVRGYEDLGIVEKQHTILQLAREREIVKNATTSVQNFQNAIKDFRLKIPKLSFIDDALIKGLPDEPQLSDIQATLFTLQQCIYAHLTAMEDSMADADKQISKWIEKWEQAIRCHENDLQNAMRNFPSAAGKSGREIGAEYQRLVADIERIKPKKAALTDIQSKIKTLEKERRNLLARLSDLNNRRLSDLQSIVKKLNKRLYGKIKIVIVPGADRSALKEFILNCKLEGIGEKRLSWISDAKTISPLALAQSIKEGADDLIRKWEVTPMVSEALTKLQPSQLMQLESLELEHQVDIFLNVAHSQSEPNYRPLDKLSTGQQCTAILHLLLLENSDPLIMDQPEDNLDNAFIAERIVSELRSAKTSRQFLFATHNANIPVFGDAEWIGVFSANEDGGSLKSEDQGSIDVPKIRDQVANILEGGRDAFIQRKEKYDF